MIGIIYLSYCQNGTHQHVHSASKYSVPSGIKLCDIHVVFINSRPLDKSIWLVTNNQLYRNYTDVTVGSIILRQRYWVSTIMKGPFSTRNCNRRPPARALGWGTCVFVMNSNCDVPSIFSVLGCGQHRVITGRTMTDLNVLDLAVVTTSDVKLLIIIVTS